jgi:hypothetical protein
VPWRGCQTRGTPLSAAAAAACSSCRARSIRQHTSAHAAYSGGVLTLSPEYLHTSAYVNIRQCLHTSAYSGVKLYSIARVPVDYSAPPQPYVSIRQHTSAYVSIRQRMPEYQSTIARRRSPSCPAPSVPAYVSIRQRMPAYVSAHLSAYVSIRQRTPAYVPG